MNALPSNISAPESAVTHFPHASRVNNDKYILAIGSSHVRSFAASSAFLPVFIGRGIRVRLSDPTLARNTIALATEIAVLARNAVAILLLFGEPEVRVHVEEGGSAANADELNQSVAPNLRGLLTALSEVVSCPIYMASAPPRSDDNYNAVAWLYNKFVAEFAAKNGVQFVDLFDGTTDQSTQAIRPEFDADGYHLAQTVAPMVLNSMRQSLGPATPLHHERLLLYRHDLPLPSGGSVRVWGDVKASEHTAAQTRSEIAERIIELLSRHVDHCALIEVQGDSEAYFALRMSAAGCRIRWVQGQNQASDMGARLIDCFAWHGKISSARPNQNRVDSKPDLVVDISAVEELGERNQFAQDVRLSVASDSAGTQLLKAGGATIARLVWRDETLALTNRQLAALESERRRRRLTATLKQTLAQARRRFAPRALARSIVLRVRSVF